MYSNRTTKARKPTSESKLGKGKDAAVEADEAAGETLPVRPLGRGECSLFGDFFFLVQHKLNGLVSFPIDR